MPIIKYEGRPFYLTVNELSQIPLFKRLILYKNDVRDKAMFNNDESEVFYKFIYTRLGQMSDYRFQYIDLVGRDALFATSELIAYFTYFYCDKTRIRGYNHKYFLDDFSLNDFVYPFIRDKQGIVKGDIEITSSELSYSFNLDDLERILGFFNEFKVILREDVITFSDSKISISPRNEYNCYVDKFYKIKYEKFLWRRYFSKLEKRNYKKFVLYINNASLYKDYRFPRYYKDYQEYLDVNSEVFTPL